MQNKRILAKLNFIHLSLVLLVLIFLFFINLLAVRNLQLREVAKGLATKGYNLYNQLNASKKGIETSAINFMGLARFNMEFDLLLDYYKQSLPQNPLIESFYILDYENEQYSTVFSYKKSEADSFALSVIQNNIIDFYRSGLGQNWINSFNKKSYQYRFYFFGRVNQKRCDGYCLFYFW
jgi:hypothetical protein